MEVNLWSGFLFFDLMLNWSDGLCRERRLMKIELKIFGVWMKVISGFCLYVCVLLGWF